MSRTKLCRRTRTTTASRIAAMTVARDDCHRAPIRLHEKRSRLQDGRATVPLHLLCARHAWHGEKNKQVAGASRLLAIFIFCCSDLLFSHMQTVVNFTGHLTCGHGFLFCCAMCTTRFTHQNHSCSAKNETIFFTAAPNRFPAVCPARDHREACTVCHTRAVDASRALGHSSHGAGRGRGEDKGWSGGLKRQDSRSPSGRPCEGPRRRGRGSWAARPLRRDKLGRAAVT